MITAVAATIGGLGLFCILSRKTMLGVLIGVQLLGLGATMMLVFSGVASGARIDGHAFGLLVAVGAVAQLAAGYTLATRLFYLKTNNDLDELRSMRE